MTQPYSNISWYNHPHDIRVMFDKFRCQRLLFAAGIPIPELIEHVTHFSELRHRLEQDNLRRVFFKLSHGSTVAGVIALHRNGSIYRAVTTMELIDRQLDGHIYNHVNFEPVAMIVLFRRWLTTFAVRALKLSIGFPKPPSPIVISICVLL